MWRIPRGKRVLHDQLRLSRVLGGVRILSGALVGYVISARTLARLFPGYGNPRM